MRYIGVIFSVFIFFSCLNDRNSPLADLPNVIDTIKVIVPPKPTVDCSPDTVYFKQTILPLVTSNCAKSGCHDAVSHKEGVILTDYTNIMREVKVSSPASSDLYKCLNETGDERMPPAPAAEFSLSNKALLLKWIQQGAKNNSCSNTANCDTINVTYNASVAPVLKTYCVGCHGTVSPSAGVDLSTYAGVKVQADNGRLLGSITHAVGYKPMPSSTSKLGLCEINQIQVWITKGTLNN
jgi:uncharacterized membrane protein